MLSINCVLDVGANTGQYGRSLRALGYTGWIISFEPVQRNLEQLRRWADRDAKWRVFPWALGAMEDASDINVMESSVFSSFLQPDPKSEERFGSANRVVKTERVEIKRLDHVLDGCLKGIDSAQIYMKLDTQGSDIRVLAGAEAILSDILALQTELAFRKLYLKMPNFTETLLQFMSKGFEVVDFIPVTRERDGLRVIEMDCIMLRSSQS